MILRPVSALRRFIFPPHSFTSISPDLSATVIIFLLDVGLSRTPVVCNYWTYFWFVLYLYFMNQFIYSEFIIFYFALILFYFLILENNVVGIVKNEDYFF